MDLRELDRRQRDRARRLTPEIGYHAPALQPESSRAALVVLKLVDGPDDSGRYRARRQRVVDFGAFADSADSRECLVTFIGMGASNLPSAASGGRVNGHVVGAVEHGPNESGETVYHVYPGFLGHLNLVEDPT